MDPLPVCSVESGADTGCLASKEREGIADPSEIVERNSTARVLERSRIQMDETQDYIEKNKEGKLPSEIAESNSDDEVKERSQTERDQTHDDEVNEEGKLPSETAESNSDDEVSQTERDETDDNEPSENAESNSDNEASKKREKREKGDEERTLYLPLYKAALADDWKTVRRILEDDPDALTAQITAENETLLHVAVSRSQSIQFLEELINTMTAESLAITNKIGHTALSDSAMFGNTEAAKHLVKKNPDLTQMRTKKNSTPLHTAATYGHKETVRYLLDETQDREPSPFSGESGVDLLNRVISSDFYGTISNFSSPADGVTQN